jgi:hypothetical protein
MPMFNNTDLIGVEIFDAADATLASALDVAPNAAAMQQKVRAVAAYVASSQEARAAVDTHLKKVVPLVGNQADLRSRADLCLCDQQCARQYPVPHIGPE